MPDLILHHYPFSPFAQKVRSMLGYTGLPWKSVMIKEAPPRPALELLTAGYRKVPVLQIGADIFCDTRVIAAELSRLSGLPALKFEETSPEAQELAHKADGTLFFACLMSSGTLKLASKLWNAMSVADIARFFLDRFEIGRKASVRTVPPKQAKGVAMECLADLEQRLTQPFLFGHAPVHADFSVYKNLWFLHDLAESKLLDSHPKILAWKQRMRELGQGEPVDMSPTQAVLVARENKPRGIPTFHQEDDRIGLRVRVAPMDYAKDPSEGLLVGVTPTTWIIAHENEALGRVHVHFPQAGYNLVVL